MRASHLLLSAAVFATLGGVLGATLGPLANGSQSLSPPAAIRADESGAVHARELSALRSEIDLLRMELRAGKNENRDTPEFEAELRSLEQEVAGLRQQVTALAAAQPPLASDGDDPAPSTPEEFELMAEEHVYEEDLKRRQLSDTFQAQSVDTLWSLDTTGLVTDAFRQEELARSSVDAVECRSSLCRLEVSHADAEAAERFEIWFPLTVGEALPQARFFSEQRDHGAIVTVLYLARDGYLLPAEEH